MTNKTNITSRAGMFTSSSIYKLMSNDRKGTGIGSTGLTYIDQKKREAKLGRQLQQEKSFRSAAWGTMLQHRVLNVLLNTSYIPVSDKREQHDFLKWNGSADFKTENSIGDIKCFELDNFTSTHDAATKGYETLKKECPDIFWQLISNAILYKKEKIKLILYVPYKEELSIIRDESEWQKILTQEQFENKHFQSWLQSLSYMEDDELPYLVKGNHYKNLTSFQFDIHESDRIALTNRVILATKILNEK